MAAFNRVFLIGNLTKDPELRYTPGGTAVATLRLAVNSRFKDKKGEMRNDVCFINCVVWAQQAETCNQYLHKGRAVFIEGRLQSRSWQDKEGKTRSVIEVRADRVQFLAQSGAQAGAQTQIPPQEPAETPPAGDEPVMDMNLDELGEAI